MTIEEVGIQAKPSCRRSAMGRRQRNAGGKDMPEPKISLHGQIYCHMDGQHWHVGHVGKR